MKNITKFSKALLLAAGMSLPLLAAAEEPGGGNNGTLMQWDDVNNGNDPSNGLNNNLNTPPGGGGGTQGAGGGGELSTSQSSSTYGYGWWCYLFPQYCGGNDVPLDGGLSIVAAAGAGIAARRVYIKKKKAKTGA